MSDFDVRKTSLGIYVMDWEDQYVTFDDNPERALAAVDDFIGRAQKARKELEELIANDEA